MLGALGLLALAAGLSALFSSQDPLTCAAEKGAIHGALCESREGAFGDGRRRRGWSAAASPHALPELERLEQAYTARGER